jgi:hypothetical protein
LSKLADAQTFERRDLVDDVQFHRVLLSWMSGNGQPVWIVSLISQKSSKP